MQTAKEQINYLGLVNDIIKEPETKEYKEYMKCYNKKHNQKKQTIKISENITRYYCKECMLSFDVDSSG